MADRIVSLDCERFPLDARNSWYYNKTLYNGNVLSNGTLVIENLSEKMQGSYMCGRINESGEMEIQQQYEITGNLFSCESLKIVII